MRHCSIFLLLLTFFFTILISSCSDSKQKLMKKEEFSDILAELIIIEKLNIPKNAKIALMQKVFENHDVEPELFQKTRQRYQEHPAFWIEVYDKAKERISSLPPDAQSYVDSLQNAYKSIHHSVK
ncbi:MAG: DUF4296 domain-containing protein [Caldithrix sp.]|nr:DUF4296 domain-containing protein [Caldithrix sp.]